MASSEVVGRTVQEPQEGRYFSREKDQTPRSLKLCGTAIGSSMTTACCGNEGVVVKSSQGKFVCAPTCERKLTLREEAS